MSCNGIAYVNGPCWGPQRSPRRPHGLHLYNSKSPCWPGPRLARGLDLRRASRSRPLPSPGAATGPRSGPDPAPVPAGAPETTSSDPSRTVPAPAFTRCQPCSSTSRVTGEGDREGGHRAGGREVHRRMPPTGWRLRSGRPGSRSAEIGPESLTGPLRCGPCSRLRRAAEIQPRVARPTSLPVNYPARAQPLTHRAHGERTPGPPRPCCQPHGGAGNVVMRSGLVLPGR